MRIPVRFGGNAVPGEALLVEAGNTPTEPGYAMFFESRTKFGHSAGCACCLPRGPAADALLRMFRARSTGAAPFFQSVRVVASPAGEEAVREALALDVVAKARYVEEG